MKEFDEYAQGYRNIHNENIKATGVDSDYFSKMKAEIIKKDLKSKKNLKILDIGCGDGNIEKFLVQYFPNSKILGIDVSSESIKKAKEKNLPNCKFEIFDGNEIKKESNSFDLVLIAGVFHHIEHEKHEKLIKEVFKILKKNGTVFVFEHNPKNIVTKKIVEKCIFDKNAVLIKAKKLKCSFNKVKFSRIKTNYILFFPRHKIFRIFHFFEKFMKWIPFGGQYYLKITKKGKIDV